MGLEEMLSNPAGYGSQQVQGKVSDESIKVGNIGGNGDPEDKARAIDQKRGYDSRLLALCHCVDAFDSNKGEAAARKLGFRNPPKMRLAEGAQPLPHLKRPQRAGSDPVRAAGRDNTKAPTGGPLSDPDVRDLRRAQPGGPNTPTAIVTLRARGYQPVPFTVTLTPTSTNTEKAKVGGKEVWFTKKDHTTYKLTQNIFKTQHPGTLSNVPAHYK